VGEKRNIKGTLKIRRGRFFGHILRPSSLLKTVLEGNHIWKVLYCANNEGRECKKLNRIEKTGREQTRLESYHKPILGLMANDDDDCNQKENVQLTRTITMHEAVRLLHEKTSTYNESVNGSIWS
jgi:hypothetical protein